MDIARQRLLNQRIAGTSFATPGEVVRWLGAVQAQDYLASLWAIGLRMRAATEAAVEQAVAARDIVRTWPMRGTLHFVPAADARWMLELLTPRVIKASAGRYRQLELDDDTFERCRKLFVAALQGGKQLTRTALYERLERAGITTRGSRGLHILSHLAQHAVICFAARAGRQPTFALFDEWLPNAHGLPRDEALAEITLRYFASHGPATVHDFAWWSGLTIGAAKQGVELVRTQLDNIDIDRNSYWSRTTSSPPRAAPKRAHLLPSYDEYTVAYRDRSAVLDARHAKRASAGGILYPTIVVDARVVGTWRRTLQKCAVAITLDPFEPLQPRQLAAIKTAAARYAAFLGADLAPTSHLGPAAY